MDLTEATLKDIMEERADLHDEIVEGAVAAKNEQLTELEKERDELQAKLDAAGKEKGDAEKTKETLEEKVATVTARLDASEKGAAVDKLLREAGVTNAESWERNAIIAELDKPEEVAAIIKRISGRAAVKPTSTLKSDAQGAVGHKQLVENVKRHLKGRARQRLVG